MFQGIAPPFLTLSRETSDADLSITQEESGILGMNLVLPTRDGDTVAVRALLSSAGAQSFINYKEETSGVTPRSCAARNGHAAVTDQLITARCNVDIEDQTGATPISIAAHCGNDVQQTGGTTPLHIATKNGYVPSRIS